MSGNKKVYAVIGAGALVIGGVLLVRALGAGDERTDDAQIEADVVSIAARVGGQVATVEVADNARVKAGDVILRLDPADLTAKLHQAQGELDAARAQAVAAEAQVAIAEAGARGGLSSAEAQVGTSKAQVSGALAQADAARAQVMRAESDAQRAASDLARALQLRAANAVPDEHVETTRAADSAAKAVLLGARAQLSAADEARKVAVSRVAEASGNLRSSTPIDAKIAAAEANAALARARVVSAQAALDLAGLALSYAVVRSPADGMVSVLRAREGQLVAAGQPLASVVPAETYVVANFKETQINRMHVGQEVEVTVDAFGAQHLKGKIESLAGATGARFSLLPPDNASGNFVKVVQRVPVRIAWTEVPRELVLRAGLSAEVTVHTR